MRKKIGQIFARKRSGLTMIELLIVIAILAVMMIILLLSLRGQTYKARDARRKADIDAYEKSFEDYFNDNDAYPPDGSLDNCNSTDLSPYMREVRCDPLGDDTPYYYWVNADETAYAICANLENDTDPAIAEVGCQAGCEPGDGNTYNYCMVINEDISVVGGDYDAVSGGGGGSSGNIACDPNGVCQNYADPVASGCPVTFSSDAECVGSGLCASAVNRCNN